MSLKSLPQTLELTQNNTTSFTALPNGFNTIVTRIGTGFSEVTGICTITASDPGGSNGVLHVEQSVDGANYDQDDTFTITQGGADTVTFSVKIVARFVRIRFEVLAAVDSDIRIGGLLKVASSP